ncbi:hypothetical protein ASG82_00335 [Mycobacterium sp. Soil538]|nr:hypothetical protein ASG82_00335 [Mycobacterium sp. Soil538]
MPRSFDFSVESSTSVEEIQSAFSERDYWLARLAAFGGTSGLESVTTDAEGSVTVIVVQDLRRELLPGLLAKLYPREWRVVQEETWSPIGGGVVFGELSFVTHGAPGSGFGTAKLIPTPTGSRLECSATVEFKVPLVGGKIESFIGGQLVDQISVVQDFTTKWIAEHA